MDRGSQIVSALAEADLIPVDVVDFDPYNESGSVASATVKLFFIVRPA
jgi:hypothetical protein